MENQTESGDLFAIYIYSLFKSDELLIAVPHY